MVGEHQTDRVKVRYQVGMGCWVEHRVWTESRGQNWVVRWVSKYEAFLSGKET